MSNLIKIDVPSLPIMARTDLLDAEVANMYPEIPNAFNSLYIQAKAKADEAKAVIDSFDGAETDEEKLLLAPLAKAIVSALKPLKGKNGAMEIKAAFKERPLKLTRLIDGGFNAVCALVDETNAPLEVIAKYADVIAYNKAQALHTERIERINIIGGGAFLHKYPDGFGNYTPEQFDEVLSDIEGWIKLANFEAAEAKRKAEAEALKAQAEAEKRSIRTARAKQLHAYGHFHDGDLAELPESDFLQLLEKAQADKADADRLAEVAKAELAKAQAEAKAKADAALAKAKAEAEVLRQAQAEAQAKADAEQKALQGDDAQKFKAIADKIKELMFFVDSVDGMSSEKGQEALAWAKNGASAFSAKAYEKYNKLR